MSNIIFKICKADDIPPLYHEVLRISENYFCKARTFNGEIKNTMARYDFKHSKWIFSYSGYNELIEYYKSEN